MKQTHCVDRFKERKRETENYIKILLTFNCFRTGINWYNYTYHALCVCVYFLINQAIYHATYFCMLCGLTLEGIASQGAINVSNSSFSSLYLCLYLSIYQPLPIYIYPSYPSIYIFHCYRFFSFFLPLPLSFGRLWENSLPLPGLKRLCCKLYCKKWRLTLFR